MDPISTYIINLKRRTERKEHILKEFRDRQEFKPIIVEAEENVVGAVGLWNTITHILREAEDVPQDYIIICEDDHQFSSSYSKELLCSAISEADANQADILCGGVSWFSNALAISAHTFWVEKSSGLQFTVIFKRFFKTITGAEFTVDDAADTKIAYLTAHKYFIFPFISDQKEFGYSDVTPRNNKKGRVETLFANSMKKAKAVKYLCDHYQNSNEGDSMQRTPADYEGLSIPTYVINLAEGGSKLRHLQEQFKGRDEFAVEIIEPCALEEGGASIWLSIRKIIESAVRNEDDIIIICRDDHQFTEHYAKELLFRHILEAQYQGIEILTGGVSEFDIAIPVAGGRFWLNTFSPVQFMVLYKSIFSRILDHNVEDRATADRILSDITNYKMTVFPFISVQKEPGNEAFPVSFRTVAKRLELAQRMYNEYGPGKAINNIHHTIIN